MSYVNNLMDCLHSTIPSAENRLHACSQRGLVQTHPVPLLASDSMYSSAHNLAPLVCGGQSGLDTLSHAAQEARDKSRRPTHSAGTTYYRNALNLPKPAGKYDSITWQILYCGSGKLVLLLIFRYKYITMFFMQCTMYYLCVLT